MNKYQEALNKIINHKCYEKESSCWDYVKTLYKEEVESLQELVDKETPMKAKWQGTDSQGATFYYSYCPKCNRAVSKYLNTYCDRCGQKLDWSGDDE